MLSVLVLSLTCLPNDARVQSQCRALADAGHLVTAVTVACQGVLPQLAHGGRFQNRTFVVPPLYLLAKLRVLPALTAARLPLTVRGILTMADGFPGVGELRAVALKEARTLNKPAVVIANDWTALPAALCLAEELGLPFHYDSHELAVEEHADRRLWRVTVPPLIAKVEQLGVAQARSFSTVSHGIAQAMAARYGLRQAPAVVPNISMAVPLPPTPLGAPVRVLYHGLFKTNRGIETLIASAAIWPDHYQLTLRGRTSSPGYAAQMTNRVRQCTRPGRIVVEAMVPQLQVVDAANQADIGVFLPEITLRQNRWALPNKLFEYLAAGLMVIVPAKTEMAEIVETHRCGLALTDPSAAGLALCLARLSDQEIANYKAAAHVAAGKLSWATSWSGFASMLAATAQPG